MNLLMDVLGIVFAFASAMLLFSLLVTMLVHAIQATINLRYQNLKHGVDVFMHAAGVCAEEAEQLTRKILSTPFENGSILKIKRTSISKEEILGKLKANPSQSNNIANIDSYISEHFSQFESFLSERYTRITHMISFVCAFAVVLVFQIHTFELLKDISSDAEFRLKLSAYGEQAIANPETVPVINATPSSANTDVKAKEEQAKKQMADQLNEIALFEFKPLPNGKEYFVSGEGKNCTEKLFSLFGRYFGLIVSAILISLGAPFWFNTLQSVASLKDKLAEYKK